MESPINPQYQEYVNDTRDQILNDLGFNPIYSGATRTISKID